jgi:guanylate kinase
MPISTPEAPVPANVIDAPFEPVLLVIGGPSGIGKDSLIKGAQRKNPRLKKIRTITTRPRRRRERNGREFDFVTPETFSHYLESGYVIGENAVGEHWYGIPINQFNPLINGGSDLALNVDMLTGSRIRGLLEKSFEPKIADDLKRRVFSVLIEFADMEELKDRFLARGGSMEEFMRRYLSERRIWEQCRSGFDLVINNPIGRKHEAVNLIHNGMEAKRRLLVASGV